MQESDIDYSVLDVPVADSIDPDEFLRTAIPWHFGEDTGSPFWLNRAQTLDFDPRSDGRPSTISSCSPTSSTKSGSSMPKSV